MTSTLRNASPVVGDISEEDVYAAMQRIPGYIDITIGGFLEADRLARDHARERLLGWIRGDDLMRSIVYTLAPSMLLEDAVALMSSHDLTLIPVVDAQGQLVGLLKREDFFRYCAERLGKLQINFAA